MSTNPTTYRVLSRWPGSAPSWRYVPEDDGVTLARARQVVRDRAHWQRCGLQQRITNSRGRVISVHRSRLASQERQDQIRRTYLPEVCT